MTSASRPSPRSAAAAAAAAAAKKAPLFPSLPALPTLALPKFYSGAKLSRAKAKLLDLVSRSARGTDPAGPGRAEVEAAIDELYAAAPRSALFPLEKDPAGIDGKWKLVREKGRERGQFFFFFGFLCRGRVSCLFFFFSPAREVERLHSDYFRSPLPLEKKTKNEPTPPHQTIQAWTSEKEVLWVIANGKRLFGVEEVGEVFQTLSLANNNGGGDGKTAKEPPTTTPALVNEIVFPPGGSFVVNSNAQARGPATSDREKGTAGSRVDFKFSGARLDVAKVDKKTGECSPAFSLPLPPFGQGWFDTVVVDGDLRIARDVRGDTLICVRAEEGE